MLYDDSGSIYFRSKSLTNIYVTPQAHNSPDELAKKMFLPLAERMTKKFVDDGRIEAEAGRWTTSHIELGNQSLS